MASADASDAKAVESGQAETNNEVTAPDDVQGKPESGQAETDKGVANPPPQQQPTPVVAQVVGQPVMVLNVTAGPPGAPAGGQWVEKPAIGMVTLIIVIILVLLFWPVFAAPLCCPCDKVMVYRAPNGAFYDGAGTKLGECCDQICAVNAVPRPAQTSARE
eukprot:TRINITY_DN6778_c0_g2_i1.p1 TRINITY_DN6778_c0_g2~~TRINITY_DN6778_c0_g2_i1.p1  ORF type:complete len:181 (+),score=16.07 TRINITY_DN6778_c0_g2_i1:62-544(+)